MPATLMTLRSASNSSLRGSRGKREQCRERTSAWRPTAPRIYWPESACTPRHATPKACRGSVLEQRLVDTVRIVADDQEIAQYGNVYMEMKNARSSSAIFPAAVANIDQTTLYTHHDYIRDMKALTPEILAMPGNATMDISKVGEDGCVDSAEVEAAIGETGSGVTVFKTPRAPQPHHPTLKSACRVSAPSSC